MDSNLNLDKKNVHGFIGSNQPLRYLNRKNNEIIRHTTTGQPVSINVHHHEIFLRSLLNSCVTTRVNRIEENRWGTFLAIYIYGARGVSKCI